MKLRHQIPSVYSGLLPREILDFEISETKATCGNCAMTRENRGVKARITYQAHLKCCTFEPMLPNYLVGDLLKAQPSPQLLAKFNGAGEPIPLALLPRADFRDRFNKRKPEHFGQREDLLCGYYDVEKQNCSIWRSRGAVCTSFLCFSDMGPSGKTFWRLLGDYLHHVEMCLAEEALVHLDFTPRQVSDQLEVMIPSKRIQPLSPADRKRIWNSYGEKEFYIRASDWVRQLTRTQMPEILGRMGLQKENQLIRQIRRLTSKRLERSKFSDEASKRRESRNVSS